MMDEASQLVAEGFSLHYTVAHRSLHNGGIRAGGCDETHPQTIQVKPCLVPEAILLLQPYSTQPPSSIC